MAYQDFKMQLLNAVFQLAGTIVTQTMTGGTDSKIEELQQAYYKKASRIAEKHRPVEYHETPKEQPPVEYEVVHPRDLSKKKIEQGTACLACSKDHFSTASGALAEALRFARKNGVDDPEVQNRLGIASDELNIMERIDLAPEKLVQLDGQEKKIALDALNESRELRHQIMSVKTPEDLEHTAAEASKIRTRFMKNVFTMAMRDGTVDKLCRNFTGDEKARCMKTLTGILEERKQEEMR